MEIGEFDQFVRRLTAEGSRRSLLKRLAGSAVGGTLGTTALTSAFADGKSAKGSDKSNGNDKGGDKSKGGKTCAGVGSACASDRDCCPGLLCGGGVCGAPGVGANAGQSTANQTVATNNSNQVCAGNCAQTNQQTAQTAQTGGNASTGASAAASVLTFGTLPAFHVDVDCTFDPGVDQSTCRCTSRGPEQGPVVTKIDLNPADLCATVLNQSSKPGKAGHPATPAQPATTGASGSQANAGNGGVANASANGGSVRIGDVNSNGGNTSVSVNANGGTANANAAGGNNNVAQAGGAGDQPAVAAQPAQPAEPSVLTVVLDGHVAPGRPMTYWLDTDAGRLPATGPSLVQTAAPSPTTGAINVVGFACAGPPTPSGFDWFGQCQRPATGMTFQVFATAGSATTPVATGTTNDRGQIRFPNLPPGTYQLAPTGSNWCHAESDSVDAQGQVVVTAGADSTIWSFTCPPGGS
jgi:Prealbumin-like fold domain